MRAATNGQRPHNKLSNVQPDVQKHANHNHMCINVEWMERYHAAQCFKPLRVEVKDSLQLVFRHHQAVVQAVQGGVNYVEAKSRKFKK